MSGYRALLEKELIEAWRTYRLAGMAGLFLVAGIVTVVFVRYLPAAVRLFAPPDYEIGLPPMELPDVVAHLSGTLVGLGSSLAILVAMGSVARERERGTAAMVLTRPVTRAAFLAAKWVTLATLFAVGLGLAVLGAWLYAGLLFEPPPVWPWIEMGLIMWLATMVQASITFLGSTILGSSLAAGGFGLLGWLGLSLAAAVPTLAPWLPSGLPEVAMSAALMESSIDLDPVRTMTISVAVIGACLVLAWLAFRRQEIGGGQPG